MNVSVDTALGSKESETTGKGYERARAILAAARAIFASEGYAGLAMRTVAARVDVNLSTVQHYFPSKDALLEALLLQTLQDYQAFVDRQVESEAGGSRLAKFAAVIDYFLDELSTSESNGVLCELFALANRNSFAAEVLDKMLTRGRKVFRNLIRSLAPELSATQTELRGALIVAQLQGLMLYLAKSRPQHNELAGLKLAARAAIVRLATEP
ncbi:MAG: TetR family transcriptional regulator [Syntrophobacteraceae bacterium]